MYLYLIASYACFCFVCLCSFFSSRCHGFIVALACFLGCFSFRIEGLYRNGLPVFGVSDKVSSNRSVQPQRLARKMKLRL